MKNNFLKSKLALEGVIQAASLGLEILELLPLTNVHRDKIKMAALERQIEIISEASRKISDDIKQKHSHINWRGIAAIGNILRHEYKNVHTEDLWHFANQDLKNILQAAEISLKELA